MMYFNWYMIYAMVCVIFLLSYIIQRFVNSIGENSKTLVNVHKNASCMRITSLHSARFFSCLSYHSLWPSCCRRHVFWTISSFKGFFNRSKLCNKLPTPRNHKMVINCIPAIVCRHQVESLQTCSCRASGGQTTEHHRHWLLRKHKFSGHKLRPAQLLSYTTVCLSAFFKNTLRESGIKYANWVNDEDEWETEVSGVTGKDIKVG